MVYYVCPDCKKWFKCVANRQRVSVPSGLIFAADKYECECGNQFYILPEKPMYDATNIEQFKGIIDDELLI